MLKKTYLMSLYSLDLMWSSYKNCENTLNFCRKNWKVKFTVVFIIPVPWVRMELEISGFVIKISNKKTK